MAGCSSCGGAANQAEMQRMEQSFSRLDGTFALYHYPDCDGGHHGAYEGLSVFVVARLTPDERIFPRDNLSGAAAYMNSLPSRPPIEKLPAVTLCDQAVVTAFETKDW